MPEPLRKSLLVIGVSLLLLGVYLAYNFVGLAKDIDSSPTLLWTVIGSGFLLSSAGLIAYTYRLRRSRRIVLALSLFLSGLVSFALAVTVAHVGLILLVLSLPALFGSVVVGLMSLLPSGST